LHLSYAGLPDWRIEKSAISASKCGHEVIFAGRDSKNYRTKTFSKTYEIKWTFKARIGIPFYWHSVKKQIERVLMAVRPDIVHAHDLFPAKMISEFGLPFVYDNHEYWSKLARLLTEVVASSASSLPKKVKQMILSHYAIYLWTKWEKELVSSCPTITVSDNIAEELNDFTKVHPTDLLMVFPRKHGIFKLKY